jgi:outer membrane protein OmpA-like peptidoglycan-associated protein
MSFIGNIGALRAQKLLSLAVVFMLALAGCKTEEVRPSAAVEGPPPPAYHADMGEAIKFIADKLAVQVGGDDLKAAKAIPVDLFFNEQSAEETASAKAIQQQLVAALAAAMPAGSFAPLSTKNIQNAQWVALAGFANLGAAEAGRPGNWVRLKVALADVRSGTTAARVMTYVDAKQFNSAPTRFYKEAPMYLTDAGHRDRAAVLAGEKRALGESLRLRAELADAAEFYESGQLAEAEAAFAKVLTLAPGHLGALSGIYQVYWKQNKKAEAEKAFSALASAGMDSGRLSVKLLFKLSSTDFIEDADLAQQYQLWLKVLAGLIAEKKVCLDVTGHASRSGSPEFNDKLSLNRATRIVSRMQQHNATTSSRLKAYGKGSAEAIVGTGTNDATDAIDRRVEFSTKGC